MMKATNFQMGNTTAIFLGATVLVLSPLLFVTLGRTRPSSSEHNVSWVSALPNRFENGNSQASLTSSSSTRKTLTIPFVTLSFNQTNSTDQLIVDHNCAALQSHGMHFHIFTDDINQPACAASSCTCHFFQQQTCECPYAKPNERCFCAKIHFLRDIMTNPSPTFDEFVFIDSDLIIVQPDQFIPALIARTRHFDFLAPYAYQQLGNWKYSNQFNSGLFFIRRNQAVDYNGLMDTWHRMKSSNDQIVFSSFVRQTTRKWDSLSLKWHCRNLERSENNIRIDECYTQHSKKPARQPLFDSGFRLQRSEDLLPVN